MSVILTVTSAARAETVRAHAATREIINVFFIGLVWMFFKTLRELAPNATSSTKNRPRRGPAAHPAQGGPEGGGRSRMGVEVTTASHVELLMFVPRVKPAVTPAQNK